MVRVEMESPKQRFLRQPEDDLKKIREVLRSTGIQLCLDVAILEYAFNQMPTGDMVTAACNQNRLEGAKSFALLLQTLADPIKKIEPPKATGVLEELK